MSGNTLVVLQYFQARSKSINVRQIALRSRRFLGPINQLHRGYGTEDNLITVALKQLPHMLRTVPDSEDADIGISMILQHQNASLALPAN
ncbi:putative Protein trbH [Pseudomonas aeruginosa]|nr:putative Protein trbH [Pseudomonas aeruginosa]